MFSGENILNQFCFIQGQVRDICQQDKLLTCVVPRPFRMRDSIYEEVGGGGGGFSYSKSLTKFLK